MRYHRNIASVADMLILGKARTFVGEYNSNWGRLIRTMRVRLNAPIDEGDGVSARSNEDPSSFSEINSNWGRLIQTMRVLVRLNAPMNESDRVGASSNEDPSESVDHFPLKSLDTRVAWGQTIPRSPGL
ncbi:hypothetical protein ACHAWC_005553 [Mediolabrus comicus]